MNLKDAIFSRLSNLLGHRVPKPSVTRWSYAYEIVKFACRHYSATVFLIGI